MFALPCLRSRRRAGLARDQALIPVLLALFEQHDRDAVLDRVAEAITPVDEPLLAVGVGHQLDWSLIAGVGQNLQQFRADAAPLAAAQSALRGAGRAEVED